MREVHLETGLHAVAAAEPARPDADVACAQAIPGDIGWIEVVAGEVRAQCVPVSRVNRDLQRLHDAFVEQIVSGLRLNGCDRRRLQDEADDEATKQRSEHSGFPFTTRTGSA